MAPSRYDWKIVDWDVKPQHNQPLLFAYALNRFCHGVAHMWESQGFLLEKEEIFKNCVATFS